jgi:ribosomal protein S15P/S13E
LFDIEEADNSYLYITNPNMSKHIKAMNGDKETSKESSEVSRLSQNVLDFIKEEDVDKNESKQDVEVKEISPYSTHRDLESPQRPSSII